jgi:hypothetical protein
LPKSIQGYPIHVLVKKFTGNSSGLMGKASSVTDTR